MFPRSDFGNRLLLTGVALVLWLPRLHGPIDLRYDAAVYFILGTSLAQGEGYRLPNEPGDIEALQYPPLLPLIVAVHQLALNTDDPATVGQALRLTYCLSFVAYLLVAYQFARRTMTPSGALFVALISGLSLQTIFLSDLLFAELPFALAATLFVVLDGGSDRPLGFVLTALAGSAAFLLRTAGIALLLAWVVAALLSRRWRQAVLRACVAVVPVVLWQVHIVRVTSSDDYLSPAYSYQRASYQYYNVSYAENIALVDPFVPELGRATVSDLAVRFGNNLLAMPTALGEGVTNRGFWKGVADALEARSGIALPMGLVLVPATIIGVLVIIGVGKWLWQRDWLPLIYLSASIGLICLTPWPGQVPRYLAPLTPFLALALVGVFCVGSASTSSAAPAHPALPSRGRGLGERELALPSGRWRMLFMAVMVFVLGIQLVAVVHAFSFSRTFVAWHAEAPEGPGGRMFYFDRNWLAFEDAMRWLRRHGERDAVVATTVPHWIYLKTGHRAVLPPMEPDPRTVTDLLNAVPTRYVIVDTLDFLDVSARYAGPAVANAEQWRLVYRAPEGRAHIYQRLP